MSNYKLKLHHPSPKLNLYHHYYHILGVRKNIGFLIFKALAVPFPKGPKCCFPGWPALGGQPTADVQ